MSSPGALDVGAAIRAGAVSAAFPIGTRVNEAGHLEVGGCDLIEVAREHGTPAYVYLPDDIRARARAYREAFESHEVDFDILFASKAAPITAIYGILAEEGLSVDVASGGELHAALRAGFDPARVYMHGNNKSAAELRMAIDSGVGSIVLDSLDEIALLDSIAEREIDVLIRLTPGIKPSTHSYIQTGQLDSKFGFGIEGGEAARAVAAVATSAHLRLRGFHAHIGSQIFGLESYVRAIEALAAFIDSVDAEGIEGACEVLNVGGGLGISYGAGESPPAIADYVAVKVEAIRRLFDPMPKILIEPGRSLVGNAGLTIYSIGVVKEIPGIRTYVAVDGGMSDNLRPMLYGSVYEGLIADRPGADPTVTATIAGKHCESGDVLIRDLELPDPTPGDVFATPATGAYGYAMANNYNGIPRPPVLFCSGGETKVVVRRETYEDLTARDVDPSND